MVTSHNISQWLHYTTTKYFRQSEFTTMKTSENSKRKLAEALFRLNKISKNKAALAINLQRTNLYAWLKGVDSAIANSKKLDLLELLGVSEGQLSTKRIHRWCIQSLDDVRFVISTLTEAEKAPQELFVLGIWPASNADAILRLTTNEQHHVYLLLYYPATESPPAKITADLLGFGTQMQSVVPLNKDLWASWLKPDEVDPGLIARTIDFEIQYNRPHEPLDDDDLEDNNDEIDDEALAMLEPPTVTKEQLKRLEDLANRALMTGRSFEQIEAEFKASMHLYTFAEIRKMQK